MPTPSQFDKNLAARQKEIASNTDRLVRKTALAVDSTVVLGTPVDTGRARSNWQVELNGPADGVIEAYVAGKGGSTAAENVTAALAQARQVIAQYSGDVPNASINITNNLDYIGDLNDGSSAQAPAGFVEKAIHVGVEAIRSSGGLMGHTISEE